MNLKRKFAISAATVAIAATAAIAPATAETVVGQDRPATGQQDVVATQTTDEQRLANAEKGVDIFAKVVKTIADTVARFVG
ncbi:MULTISPECIES: hypothetical protein [unclassified Corynebacterium]|uniref:hypothetical protein n=1 Tax=unclassified Corynebacterium TaxID=2624378 RepID=UPI0029C9CF9C|nr:MULTISPECIES: hypothetical protein [unclassified Corynebacterium]WPF65518.1 hypothetical protein OLX12_08000 [Corynebacterium sp. 22KM0430]WPF68014.1 hypothetical protein OLW90_07995 [Corynebacterium sp. 21KM1197]